MKMRTYLLCLCSICLVYKSIVFTFVCRLREKEKYGEIFALWSKLFSASFAKS